MTTPIASVDQLCAAVQKVLEDNLVKTMKALGFTGEKYSDVHSWSQLPTVEAIAVGAMPAGAIAADGVVGDPAYSRSTDEWTTTWQIGVAMYDRGRDHADTQARVRNWAAGIRTTVMAHRGLGGLAKDLRWSGEGYDLLPDRDKARTIAAAAVTFDVTAAVLARPPVGDLPTVTSTATTVTVRPATRRTP